MLWADRAWHPPRDNAESSAGVRQVRGAAPAVRRRVVGELLQHLLATFSSATVEQLPGLSKGGALQVPHVILCLVSLKAALASRHPGVDVEQLPKIALASRHPGIAVKQLPGLSEGGALQMTISHVHWSRDLHGHRSASVNHKPCGVQSLPGTVRMLFASRSHSNRRCRRGSNR